MYIKTVALLALISFTVIAEDIGDFAPMETGNKWVYEHIYKKSVEYTESTTVTFQVIETGIRNDTLFYLFLRSKNGVRILIPSMVNPQTESIDSLSVDTLFKVDDSVLVPTGFPVLNTHVISDEPAVFRYDPSMPPFQERRDSLYIVDGKYELDIALKNNSLINPVSSTGWSSSRTYRQGIGLVSYSFSVFDHTRVNETSQKLLVFSNEPVMELPAITTHGNTPIVRYCTRKTEKVLSLPHLSIMNNGRVFNIMGRCVLKNNTLNTRRLRSEQ